MRPLSKFAFNVLNEFCPSSLVRGKILALYGAKIGIKVRVEKIVLMNFDGFNLRNLMLKDGAFIGPSTILDIRDRIEIGRSVKIGSGCNISTHSDAGQENLASERYPAKSEEVVIGDGAWIGVGVIILCGVIVGENAIIGAGSMVNRDVPPSVVAFGVPVRIKDEG